MRVDGLKVSVNGGTQSIDEIFLEFCHMERFFHQSYSARSANPLGKLMDFLQEDVDSMQVGSTKLFCNFLFLR